MLSFQLALLKTIAASALSLQLVRPTLPAVSTSSPNLAPPNQLQTAANVSLKSNSSSAIPSEWDGTIALPLTVLNISLSSPSSNDSSPLLKDTYISTFNISAKPPPPPELPPLPRGWGIHCSRELGTGIDPSSCLEAWTLIPPIERTISLGPRNAADKYDVGLPKRYQSSDGTCFIEPALLHRNTIAHVKPSDAGIAAAYVIRQCVGNPPARGGYTENGQVGMWHEQAFALGSRGITDFTDHGDPGGNDDLAVFIRKFVPNVACSTQPYPRDSAVLEACEAIVDQMPTSKQQRIFAQEDICDPNLETPLPVYMTAPAKADIQLESTEMRAQSYREAASAICRLVHDLGGCKCYYRNVYQKGKGRTLERVRSNWKPYRRDGESSAGAYLAGLTSRLLFAMLDPYGLGRTNMVMPLSRSLLDTPYGSRDLVLGMAMAGMALLVHVLLEQAMNVL